MMRLAIEINGDEIYAVEVFNRGPVGDGDLRRYEWKDSQGYNGAVLHHRSEGAKVLAALVYAARVAKEGHDPSDD